LDYSIYKKIEEVLLDYGLAKAIEETADEDMVDLETARRLTGYDK
jgi:ubiquitin